MRSPLYYWRRWRHFRYQRRMLKALIGPWGRVSDYTFKPYEE